MTCPECRHPHTSVVDARRAEAATLRRRRCAHCGEEFQTEERVIQRRTPPANPEPKITLL
jgi:transcriptional regulator NrdR family protein